MPNDPKEKYPKYPIVAPTLYELFGFKPLAPFTKDELERAYKERFDYWQTITNAAYQADKTRAKDEIMKARKVLIAPNEKAGYDARLEQDLAMRLEAVIVAMVKTDKELDAEEEAHIQQTGQELGLAPGEIKKQVDDVLQKLGAKRVLQRSRPADPHAAAGAPIPTGGRPVLKFLEGESKRRLVFSNVRLGTPRTDSFKVFNDSSGFLEVEIFSSAPWLSASPSKFNQNDIDRPVIVTVDPSQDSRCKHGFRGQGALELRYKHGNGYKSEKIEVELAIEGYEETAARHTRYAVWSAAGLAGIYLMYLVNTVRFTMGYFLTNLGGRFDGGLAVEIALGALLFLGGALAVSKNKNAGYWLAIAGGVGLALVSMAGLLALLSIPLTWALAKLVFKKYPTQQAYIAAVPSVVFMLGWMSQGFFPTNLIAHFTPRDRYSAPLPTPALPLATVIAPEGARLRARPSKSSNTITTIRNGASVKVLGRERDWYQVQYEGAGRTQVGYVFQDLLRVAGEVPVAMGGAAQPSSSSSPTTTPQNVTPPETAPAQSAEASGAAAFGLTIHSQPSSAKLFLNEASHGETPQTLTLAPGAYALRLQHAGFHEFQDTLQVGEGMDSELTFELEAQHALLGRWEGTFGDKPLVIVIDAIQGEALSGYGEVRRAENSEAAHMLLLGKWDTSAATLSLTQHGAGLPQGTFTGKLSAEGTRLSGTWTFSQDESQIYEWSVQRVKE